MPKKAWLAILDPEEPRKPETGAPNRSWVPENHSQGLQRDFRTLKNELRDPPEDLPEHPKAPSGLPDPSAAGPIPENLNFPLVFLLFATRPGGRGGQLVCLSPLAPHLLLQLS